MLVVFAVLLPASDPQPEHLMQTRLSRFEAGLLERQEFFSSCLESAEERPFLPVPIDNLAFMRQVLSSNDNEDAHRDLTQSCSILCQDGLRFYADLKSRVDRLRRAVATLALSIDSMRSSIRTQAHADKVVEEFQDDPKLIQARKDVLGLVVDLEEYLKIEPKFEGESVEFAPSWVSGAGKQVQEAQSLVRNLMEQVKSRWNGSFQRVLDNMDECVPKDWRSYTIEDRDEKQILSNIVENPKGSLIALRVNATRASLLAFEKAMQGIAPLAKSRRQTIVDATQEANLMVGVRAVCSVTLVKLKEPGQSAKAKVALVRETRRLISALDVKLPQQLWAHLEAAAASKPAAASAAE